MPRTVLKRAALAVASVVVFFGLLELGLRAAGFWYPPEDEPIAIWNRLEDQDMRMGRGMHASVPRQLWVPRPGSDVPWGKAETINAAGYRGPLRPLEKRPGCVRIVTLGDSSTFGHSVPYEGTYSAQLETLLREHGLDVEVIDFGVVGYTIRQGLERYKAVARAWHPDFVVAAFGAVNEHLQAPLDVVDADKIEAGMELGGFWAGLGLVLRKESRVVHLLCRCVDALRGVTEDDRHKAFMKVRKHENQRAYMGAVEWRGTRRVSLEDFERALVELEAAALADGARLVLLSMPRRKKIEKDSPVLLEYSALVARLARERGLPLVDGRAAFQAVLAGGAGEEALFADGYHPKPKGHRLLAMSLAQAIQPLITGE
jgi:lysophospholipase L1-like esterase